jgi:hypothetical protein
VRVAILFIEVHTPLPEHSAPVAVGHFILGGADKNYTWLPKTK